MKFCSNCGATVIRKIPPMDDRLRFVCTTCGVIHYENPRMVVGTIPVWEGRILLCRRGIEPQYGLWTLPAGYLENGEETREGAERETFEEAGAKGRNLVFYRLFDVPFINQVFLFFRMDLDNDNHSPGIESLDTALFPEEEIPWDDLAFPIIHDVLKEYFSDRNAGNFLVRTGLPVYRVTMPS